jgi:hypothetical protein
MAQATSISSHTSASIYCFFLLSYDFAKSCTQGQKVPFNGNVDGADSRRRIFDGFAENIQGKQKFTRR